MQALQAILAELRTAFQALSRNAKIGASVGLVIVACAFCTLGTTFASRGSGSAAASPTDTAQIAQATATPNPTATPKPTATSTTPPKPKAWVMVQHFTGTQNQQTATFHLPDGSRIVWTETLTNVSYNAFSVELYHSDGSLGDLVVNNANDTSNQSSTYNVHGDSDVYLKITSDQVSYDIQVQVYQ